MKHWILLLYLGFSVMLRAQNTASVQEAWQTMTINGDQTD